MHHHNPESLITTQYSQNISLRSIGSESKTPVPVYVMGAFAQLRLGADALRDRNLAV